MTENSISTWPCFLSISAQMLFVSTNMEECVGCVKHFVDQALVTEEFPLRMLQISLVFMHLLKNNN